MLCTGYHPLYTYSEQNKTLWTVRTKLSIGPRISCGYLALSTSRPLVSKKNIFSAKSELLNFSSSSSIEGIFHQQGMENNNESIGPFFRIGSLFGKKVFTKSFPLIISHWYVDMDLISQSEGKNQELISVWLLKPARTIQMKYGSTSFALFPKNVSCWAMEIVVEKK